MARDFILRAGLSEQPFLGVLAGFLKEKIESSGSGVSIHLLVPALLFLRQRDQGSRADEGVRTSLCLTGWRIVSETGGYISRRPSIAFHMVTSSANSMSLPTGMPMAMRVTFTPNGLSSFDK